MEDLLEELKRRVANSIFNKDDTPDEIIDIVKQAFEGIEEKYKQLNCNSYEIEQYIKGNFDELKVDIDYDIGKTRRNEQSEQVQYVLYRIEKQLEERKEEKIEKEERRQNEETNKNEILSIESRNGTATSELMDMLKDSLQDIQLRQNQLLSSRGYNADQIDDIKDEVRRYIMEFKNGNEDEIYELFGQDDYEIKQTFLQEYEAFLEEVDKRLGLETEILEDEQKVNQFKESLNANIGLEEQNNIAKELNKTEKENKGLTLPDNLLE